MWWSRVLKGEAAIDVKDLEAKKPKSSGVRRDGWMDGWMVIYALVNIQKAIEYGHRNS